MATSRGSDATSELLADTDWDNRQGPKSDYGRKTPSTTEATNVKLGLKLCKTFVGIRFEATAGGLQSAAKDRPYLIRTTTIQMACRNVQSIGQVRSIRRPQDNLGKIGATTLSAIAKKVT